MNKASLVDRRKQSCSEQMDEMNIVAGGEDRWLEKFNQLKEFYQKHGHTKVPYCNGADNSLCNWVINQRRRCNMENRTTLLKSIGFVMNENIVAREDRWLE